MPITIAVSDDKVSTASRISRGHAAKSALANSALVKAHPDLEVELQTLVGESDDLEAADKVVFDSREKLAIAEKNCEGQVRVFDAQHKVCVSLLQKYAVTPEEARGCGFEVLERESYDLATPLAIEARQDLAAQLLRLRVVLPPGMDACNLEVSTNPNEPESWKRIPGHGMRRKLKGYVPGTYWFRAASVVADAESAYCAPVMVVVK